MSRSHADNIGEGSRPAFISAAGTAAALSLLFMGVYGGCNWITAHRINVGTWFYGWERFIPFVPVFILPYMSIDLFFVAAPFVCGSRAELRTLSRRVEFVILVAGACFLLFPLKLGIPRPQATGWLGAIFSFLHGFDQPYNLFPSLHIALRTILAQLYARHSRGWLRAASNVWFSLIGLSTLLTYQHHFVDVVGGFVLGLISLHVFREEATWPAVIPNRRVAALYGAGAVCCAALALVGWPWTAILLWPAVALAITATAYLGLGPGIYLKHGGRLSFGAWVLFAPSLAGQYLSLWHYRRQSAGWNKVTPQVWIGAKLSEKGACQLARRGVTAVLDLTCEFSEAPTFRKLAYRNIPVLDLTQLTDAQLREAIDFIERESHYGIVYVHCKAGYSRTAAAVGAWLLASGRADSVEDAMAILGQVRPGIIFRPEVLKALGAFKRLPKLKPASAMGVCG